MKFSNITAANLAKAANPADNTLSISKISDFSKGNTRENAKFASVRCGDWTARDSVPGNGADPLAPRVAELIAAGWSPWNAKARAESEALPGWESPP